MPRGHRIGKVFSVYRLQALLEAKERAKSRAEIALAKAIGKLEEAKKKEKKLKEEKTAIGKRRKEARKKLEDELMGGPGVAGSGERHVAFMRGLEEDEKKKDQEIEKQQEVVAACETACRRARRDYIDAVKELRVMEKHKKLWEKKLKTELDRREDEELDEISQMLPRLASNRQQAWME